MIRIPRGEKLHSRGIIFRTSFSISGASTYFFLRVLRKRRLRQFLSGGPRPCGQRYFLSTLCGSFLRLFGEASSFSKSSPSCTKQSTESRFNETNFEAIKNVISKKNLKQAPSVADPGCLSRILIFTHPGSRISDQKTARKESCKSAKEKNLGQFSKNYRTFYPKKLSLSSQKYGFGIRDPVSGKTLFRIPDPGVKKAPDPGSRIRNTASPKLYVNREKYVF